MKIYALVFAISLSCAAWQGALAQENYYNAQRPAPETPPEATENIQKGKNITVTSVGKCYQQIGRAEAVEIQKNFIKPYRECQRRLALQIKKSQEKKTAAPPAQEETIPPKQAPEAAGPEKK